MQQKDALVPQAHSCMLALIFHAHLQIYRVMGENAFGCGKLLTTRARLASQKCQDDRKGMRQNQFLKAPKMVGVVVKRR